MRGMLVKRGETYSAVVDQGFVEDTTTGKRKRKQKWITIKRPAEMNGKDYKTHAEVELTKLVGSVNDGSFVNPSKTTLVEYLGDVPIAVEI